MHQIPQRGNRHERVHDLPQRPTIRRFLVFFFSSRRRHTRWTGDWSSDVCSSDLEPRLAALPLVLLSSLGGMRGGIDGARTLGFDAALTKPVCQATLLDTLGAVQIGRASCREREYIAVGA